MLKKIIKQASLIFNNRCQHAESQKYQEKYQRINDLLVENPKILNIIHYDLKKMRAPAGKESQYSSDMILRMLIVKFTELLPWRDAITRIELDMVLRNFVGAGFAGNLPNYSYLCGAHKFIQSQTWQKVNVPN